MRYEGVRERARRTGQCLANVYQLLWAGRIPGAEKVGRTWLIPVEPSPEREQTSETRLMTPGKEARP